MCLIPPKDANAWRSVRFWDVDCCASGIELDLSRPESKPQRIYSVKKLSRIITPYTRCVDGKQTACALKKARLCGDFVTVKRPDFEVFETGFGRKT